MSKTAELATLANVGGKGRDVGFDSSRFDEVDGKLTLQ